MVFDKIVSYNSDFQKKYNLNASCLSALVNGKSKHTRN